MSLLALPMPGCTLMGESSNAGTDSFCENAYAVFLSTDEHFDDTNARKIEAEDLYGMKHCGWKTID